ncbi:MAG: hypothetical protein K2X91_09000, partial [Thermoleophilia bacterium]|nr:hypothetical protein [Thermoleophilia bacterium]
MTPPDPIAALRLAGPPRLVTLPTPALDWPPPHEQAWARLCAQNPRLHDGPIWAVAHADAAEIAVYPDRYKRLSIQADPAVGDLGIRQLGVKGLSVAPGADGRPRLLLARRGPRVRTYPRLWETAPAGGVTLPGPLTHTSIIDALSA